MISLWNSNAGELGGLGRKQDIYVGLSKDRHVKSVELKCRAEEVGHGRPSSFHRTAFRDSSRRISVTFLDSAP